ncbi:MAG: AMP-binding protein [Candidatus Tectomicrobia bacterium]|nr:AMP-binding protein [Candidatus Tectomicrobia bacterium]
MREFWNRHTRESPYWNPYTETMPREQLRQMQFKRVNLLLEYAYARSPLYRRVYRNAGMEPGDITSWDDFVERVPLLDKKDLLEAQAEHPPFGACQAAPLEHYFYLFQTSGSTGMPMMTPFSFYAAAQNGDQWAHALWGIGMRQTDSAYFAFNWGTFSGFWAAYWGCRRLGATVYSGGGLDTRQRIRQILELRPTVLLSTPTYALYMAEVARDLGVDLAGSSIRLSFHAGEPGVNIPATREAIESAWGCTAHECYGVAEAGSLAAGCPTPGMIHIVEDFSTSVVLDENGRQVGDGEVGENITTCFNNYLHPIIKYRTHDLVRPRYDRCACGRTSLRFEGGVLGRTDHMIIIKGTNVYPSAIEALMGKVPGLTEHFEIHVDREQRNDTVLVKVEAAPRQQAGAYAKLRDSFARLLHESIKVRIGVEVLPPQSLPRYELKAKRLFDHRPKEHRWQVDQQRTA